VVRGHCELVAFSVATKRKVSNNLKGARKKAPSPTWFAGKGKVFAMLDNHHQ
jgi:hypothetical protein